MFRLVIGRISAFFAGSLLRPDGLPVIVGTMAKHGGETLFADYAVRFEAGEKKAVTVGGMKWSSGGALSPYVPEP